jgi:hypothetical protein
MLPKQVGTVRLGGGQQFDCVVEIKPGLCGNGRVLSGQFHHSPEFFRRDGLDAIGVFLPEMVAQFVPCDAVAPLLRNRRVERYLDSICCFIIGTILLFIVPALGCWIILCSACLRVLEADVYERELDQKIYAVNGLLHSKNLSEVVEKFEDNSAASPQQTPSEVSTGMGDDILNRIKRRKSNQTTQKKG